MSIARKVGSPLRSRINIPYWLQYGYISPPPKYHYHSPFSEKVGAYKRTSLNGLSGDWTWFQTVQLGNNVPFDNSGSTPTTRWAVSLPARSFNGVYNPYWRYQVRYGNNATTPASGVEVDYNIPYWYLRSKFWNGLSGASSTVKDNEVFGRFPPASFTSGSAPAALKSDVQNRVIRRFIEKVNQVRGSVESGQDFGEYHQAVGSFMRPVDRARNYVLSYFPAVKKLRTSIRGTKDLATALAHTYLEWTYGWNPLVQDIAQAYVELSNAGFDRTPIQASAHGDYVSAGFNTQDRFPLGSDINLLVNYRKTSRYSLRYKGMVKTGRVNGKLPVLQSLQLTPEFWAPTAWDLLPYSFIADYFANIGDIISAASFCFSNVAWGNVSEVDYTIRVGVPVLELIHGQTGQQGVYQTVVNPRGENSVVSQKTFHRTALVSADLIPDFSFKLPFSSKPYENMGALLLANAERLVPFF